VSLGAVLFDDLLTTSQTEHTAARQPSSSRSRRRAPFSQARCSIRRRAALKCRAIGPLHSAASLLNRGSEVLGRIFALSPTVCLRTHRYTAA
jgi:hypothetical protein